MRTNILFSAFAILASASPTPQDIEFDVIDEAPEPTVTGPPINAVQDVVAVNTASLAASAAAEISANPLSKRILGENDPCGVQPDGFGPKPPTDDPIAFLAFQTFSTISVGALVPNGYTKSFSNLQGSVNGNIYLGLTTINTYDPRICSELCDAKEGCTGFNIFFERDPTLNPAPACPDPAGFTNIKCTLWGGGVSPEIAVNMGQTREAFKVVIAGSNGYNKRAAPARIPGFNGPTSLGGAINAPLLENGTNTYLGVKFFPTAYLPSICATACEAQTAYNRRHAKKGVYRACNFFAAYVTSINNVPQGLYCSLYTAAWDPKYATNMGQHRGRDYYSISQAHSYTLAIWDSGRLPTASKSKSNNRKGDKNDDEDDSDSDSD